MWRHTDAWTPDDIGDRSGTTAVVTGANSGIGYEVALELAAHGAHVLLACRNPRAASLAADRIVGASATASVRTVTLDLASLASVRAAAAEISGTLERLDVLVDNAGVMATGRRTTEDGFELQMGTNHLGHFALTGLLLDLLLRTRGSRVVSVSSTAHRLGRLDARRLDAERLRNGGGAAYQRWLVYGNSKLANLLFTDELHRRLTSSEATTLAVAAHPGWARTNLVANGPGGSGARLQARLVRFGSRFLGQSAAAGAAPVLYAATAPDVRGGQYFGPGGPFEQFGPPVRVNSTARSHDRQLAARLWELSEEATGVHYDLPDSTAAAVGGPPSQPATQQRPGS